MSKNLTPKAFRKWLDESPSGAEIAYTTEAVRDEDLMEIARVALDEGRVVLLRRRLNEELWMVARTVSGRAKRFLKAAPTIGKRGRPTYQDPRSYVPFNNPSGRGLRRPTIPDGFDGPASRRYIPAIGGGTDDADEPSDGE